MSPYLCPINSQLKQKKMTHTIQHTYDEILNAGLPGLEIHIVYNCESEICFDEEGGEESNRLLEIKATVNGVSQTVERLFPYEYDSREAREFLAKLRESARQALWAKAIEAAKEAGYTDAAGINVAAERWQRTGNAKISRLMVKYHQK